MLTAGYGNWPQNGPSNNGFRNIFVDPLEKVAKSKPVWEKIVTYSIWDSRDLLIILKVSFLQPLQIFVVL